MDIGKRIKLQRNVLGISQQELSNRLGLSIDTVRSLETNRAKPSVETLDKLCDIFDCSADYLLGKTLMWKPIPKEELIALLEKELTRPEERHLLNKILKHLNK